jgi:hypothetical protein
MEYNGLIPVPLKLGPLLPSKCVILNSRAIRDACTSRRIFLAAVQLYYSAWHDGWNCFKCCSVDWITQSKSCPCLPWLVAFQSCIGIPLSVLLFTVLVTWRNSKTSENVRTDYWAAHGQTLRQQVRTLPRVAKFIILLFCPLTVEPLQWNHSQIREFCSQ